MNVYRCRRINPGCSGWTKIAAASPEDAANDFAFTDHGGIATTTERQGERCFYLLVEVEGEGVFLARRFVCGGKHRRGGVPKIIVIKTLDEVAEELGVDAEEITRPGPWIGEEPYPGECLEDYYDDE